jgi:hypothetical protein
VAAGSQVPFVSRRDEVTRDASGLFWAPGVSWLTDQASLSALSLVVRTPGAADANLVDPASGAFDADTGLITFNSAFGGAVTMNTRSGLIQLRGAVLPRNGRILLTYSPRYVSLGAAQDANYRSVRGHFDQNLVPAPVLSTSSDERDNLSYWYNEGHIPVNNHSTIRNDRLVVALSRTSSDGAQAARGFLGAFRMGVQLPAGVFVNTSGPNFGQIDGANFNVNFTAAPSGAFTSDQIVPAGFRSYEVDPINGRVYFQSEAEGRSVAIRFRGVDASGRDLGLITVVETIQLTREAEESPIPMEQPANESGFFMIGDSFRLPNLPTGMTQAFPVTRYWMIWTSTRTGNMDIYLQTIAPRFYSKAPNP